MQPGKYRQLARLAGYLKLSYDRQSRHLFGVLNSYHVTLSLTDHSGQNKISVFVERAGEEPSYEEMQEITRLAELSHVSVQGRQVIFFEKNRTKGAAWLAECERLLHTILRELSERGYRDTCDECGGAEGLCVRFAFGQVSSLCPSCYEEHLRLSETTAKGRKNEPESLFGGIAGALLGSILGAGTIVLFGQLGFISVFSGLLMGILTLRGYALLGGRLSRRGIWIGVAFMLVMTYLGNQADWAFLISREVGINIFSAYRIIPDLLKAEIIVPSVYWSDLVRVYLFSAIGALPMIASELSTRKKQLPPRTL